jgi:hypothetical protein
MYTHVSKYKNDKIKREKSKYKPKKETQGKKMYYQYSLAFIRAIDCSRTPYFYYLYPLDDCTCHAVSSSLLLRRTCVASIHSALFSTCSSPFLPIYLPFLLSMSTHYSLHVTTENRRINSHSVFKLAAQEFALNAH